MDQDFNQFYFVKDEDIDLVFPLSNIKKVPKIENQKVEPAHVKLKEEKLKKM
jgi:hypothetical protein